MWMVEEGLWWTQRGRGMRVHQSRPRRQALDELVQIDGSPHRWFEDRGPSCTLIVFIDDATSQLMALRFVDSARTLQHKHPKHKPSPDDSWNRWKRLLPHKRPGSP